MKLRYPAKNGTEATYELKTGALMNSGTIGRDVSCAVPLDDPKASRTNTVIVHWDGFFVIRDAGSRNGTFLNGQKVEFAKLKGGDMIRIGNTDIRVED